MAFLPDYPGAIVVEAANYGYGVPNRPKTWGFHTPEEPADSYPSTPEYLATTDRDASYTYFDSYLGFIFQLVPESEGAYAHGLEGKPEPHWSDGSNLNLQSFSLSFEGYAATIHQTMPRGCPQWVAGVNLVAHRTKALGLNLDWAFQHKQVSIYRGDCGQFDQAAFIADVKAKMQEDDMDQATFNKMFAEAVKTVPIPRRDSTTKPTSGNHAIGVHLEGLFQVATGHAGDSAKHSGGEHTHEATVTLK